MTEDRDPDTGAAPGTPVVMVALGTRFPPTLIAAARQADRQLPGSPVHVIVDDPAMSRRLARRLPGCTIHDVEDLPVTDNWERFTATSEQDMTFRAGFWKLTAQRLFALERFLASGTGGDLLHGDLIHIENDYLLLCEEEDLHRLREQVTGVAMPVGDPDHVYASFVYVRQQEALTEALRVLLTILAAHPRDNEMRLLAHAMATSDVYSPLPTLPGPTDRLSHPALPVDPSDTLPADVQWRTFPSFGVLYDAITLGQYLSGIDPANYAFIRRPGFANQSSWVNPVGQRWQVTRSRDRWQLLLASDTGWLRVVGLHLHGKDVRVLDDRGARWLSARIRQTQEIGEVTALRRSDLRHVDVGYFIRYGLRNPRELRMATIAAGSLILRGSLPLPARSRQPTAVTGRE